MKKVKFLREPGYMYDLFFLFVLSFNKDFCITSFVNEGKAVVDTEYFNKLLLDYDEIQKDILPFFHINENGLCFMTQYYYESYANTFTSSFSLPLVQEALSDHEQVVENLLQFYFPKADVKEILHGKKPIFEIGKLIRKSGYSDTVKSSLYAFFIDPSTIINKLFYELMLKEQQLKLRYEKEYSRILEVQNELNLEEFAEKWKACKNHSCNLENYNEIYFSICLLHKNCLKYVLLENGILLVVGVDYLDILEFCITQKKEPELDVFGNALAEKNRVDILNLILQKKEISIKDIEQELKFTGTNAYYHLSLMIRANMISSRNQGRTVLYSINIEHFREMQKLFDKYIERG